MAGSGPFYLSNQFLGEGYHLDFNTDSTVNGLVMTTAPGLQWHTTAPNGNGEINFNTTYMGTQYCLDILNLDGSTGGNRTTPRLAACSDVSGQQWTSTPNGDNYFKFSNDFTGMGFFLDTFADTHQATMSAGNFTGQDWRFLPAHAVSTSSATPTQTTSVSSPSSSNDATTAPSRPTGLDQSTKLGLGLGLGVGVPVLAFAVILACFIYRRKKKQTGTNNTLNVEKIVPGAAPGLLNNAPPHELPSGRGPSERPSEYYAPVLSGQSEIQKLPARSHPS